MHRFALVAVLTALGGAAQAAPIPEAYSASIQFGDSLSDRGNVFGATRSGPVVIPRIPVDPSVPIPRYFQGRFSDGPVWADLVGAKFAAADKPDINVAFGISGALVDDSSPIEAAIPDLPQQIGLASTLSSTFGPRPLATVWTGSNDLFRFVEDGGPTPEEAAQGLLRGLASLPAIGIRDIVVFTLPDIGRIPRYARFQPDLSDAATDAAARFNAVTLAGIETLDLPGVRIDTFRIDLLFDALLDDPGFYGIANATDPCIVPRTDIPGLDPFFTPVDPSPPPASICTDASLFAFFDANHASATVHAEIAAEFLARVDPRPAVVPVPAALPLLVGALTFFAAFRASRQRFPK